MGVFRDLTGVRVGRLVSLRVAGKSDSGGYKWLCQCDCGNSTVVQSTHLIQKAIQSCGCWMREVGRKMRTKHGKRFSPEYNSYRAAKARCTNPNADNYPRYGGIGVKFLFKSFEEFYKTVGRKPEPKRLYSLDRWPDSSGNYQPGNVRWATLHQQRHNRRKKHVLG